MKLQDNNNKALIILTMIYAVLLLIVPIFSTIIVKVGIFTFASGLILASLYYTIVDVLNELYPKKEVRQVINFGFYVRPFMYALMWFVLSLPVIKGMEQHDMVTDIMLGSTWMMFVGMCSTWLSQSYEVIVNRIVAKKTEGKLFLLRNYISTATSASLGTIIHQLIGYGIGGYLLHFVSEVDLVAVILSSIVLRLSYAFLVSTPLAQLIIYILKKLGYVSLSETRGVE